MAARNGLTVVVQELLAKGASVLAVDENGKFTVIAFNICYNCSDIYLKCVCRYFVYTPDNQFNTD